MDPVYGYEAVNVEAQQSDSSSLLHWMRNMIALRKLFRVFGRGTLEFLQPENRKVLAYVRKYEDEQVLCVANLSRFGQPVELDLSALAGMVPVEMLGFTEFPAIGRAPYRLTLGPVCVLLVRTAGHAGADRDARASRSPRKPAPWSIRQDPEELFRGKRAEGAGDRDPARVPAQSSDGSEAKRGRSRKTRILDWMWLQREAVASALVLVEVKYADGSARDLQRSAGDRHRATGGSSCSRPGPRPCFAICERGTAPVCCTTRLADDAACRALLEAIADRPPHCRAAPARPKRSPPRRWPAWMATAAELKVTRGSAEQSNTSILFGGKLILKLFRRLERGPNPDFEIGRYLTETGQLRRDSRAGGRHRIRRAGRRSGPPWP